eukprot:TRINITY_DN74449_c0_g1_i1.p1 TRINITY_DN74449_c0_g1~~TRINITY_DN74449_c0_g1_i1.p1  ORF type:complete len:450 (+),score=149.86 TRINITY_DN74449_c0_g1_i1:107-1456(+)
MDAAPIAAPQRDVMEQPDAPLFNKGAPPAFGDVIKAYPHTMGPLLALGHSVMDMDGVFTQAEKYLMAGLISKLMGCSNCRESLETAAIACGVDDGVLQALIDDMDSAPVAATLKPVLRYQKKVTLEPHLVTEDDWQAILDAGWCKRAVFDSNAIVGVISALARMSMGFTVTGTSDKNKAAGQLLATKGYTGMAMLYGADTPFMTDEVHRASSGSKGSLIPGQRVTLQNLKNPLHNGKCGKVLEYVVHAGNWRVELDNAVVIRVTEDNCNVNEVDGSTGSSGSNACTPEPVSQDAQDTQDVKESKDSQDQDDRDSEHNSSDGECPPLSESPSSYTLASNVSSGSNGNHVDPYTQRRNELASSRFQRVQDRMAKDFATKPVFLASRVDLTDTTETIEFTVNTKWEKGRKALFAKAYTKLYKDGQRKLRVVIVEEEAKKKGGVPASTNSSIE